MGKDGIKETEAKAIVKSIVRLQTVTLATKADVAELRDKVKSDISDLKHEMLEFKHEVKSDISDLEIAMHKNNWFLIKAIGIIGTVITVASKL